MIWELIMMLIWELNSINKFLEKVAYHGLVDLA
jgi:hypothetical protein